MPFDQGYALIVGVGADLSNTVDDAVGLANILKDTVSEAHVSHPRIKHEYTNDVAAHLCIRGKFVDGPPYFLRMIALTRRRRFPMEHHLPNWRVACTPHRDIREDAVSEAHVSHPRIQHEYTHDVAAHLCIRGRQAILTTKKGASNA